MSMIMIKIQKKKKPNYDYSTKKTLKHTEFLHEFMHPKNNIRRIIN